MKASLKLDLVHYALLFFLNQGPKTKAYFMFNAYNFFLQ